MANAITYRGYEAVIEHDHDEEIPMGHIAGLDEIVAFHADSLPALEGAFRKAVDDYLERRVAD